MITASRTLKLPLGVDDDLCACNYKAGLVIRRQQRYSSLMPFLIIVVVA